MVCVSLYCDKCIEMDPTALNGDLWGNRIGKMKIMCFLSSVQ